MKTFMGMFTLVALALVIAACAIFGDGVHSMHCDMELVPR